MRTVVRIEEDRMSKPIQPESIAPDAAISDRQVQPGMVEPQSAKVAIRLLPGGHVPQYASLHAAGCDLVAASDMVIRPGETVCLPLGFIMALPPDCEAQVRPRSGLSLRTSLRVPNTPGTIDADYRNEVAVILENAFNPATLPGLIATRPALLEELQSRCRLVRLRDLLPDAAFQPDAHLSVWLDQPVWVDADGLPYGTIRIRAGERIAQMVVASFRRAIFDLETDPLATGHDRGGGFGSTGTASRG